jgi:hypothetical protein
MLLLLLLLLLWAWIAVYGNRLHTHLHTKVAQLSSLIVYRTSTCARTRAFVQTTECVSC